MEIFIVILLFIFLFKCFLFWLWLWQLKEYHWGRFKAHFETQAVKKILSSFWRLKRPKITKKTLIISFSGFLLLAFINYLAFSLGFQKFFFSALFLIILIPFISSLIVFLFQMPTVILRKRILKKAKEKREKFNNLLVIAVVGSYGKSSVKEFLATILSQKYNVLKTKENQNSEMGISQCILNHLNKEHEIFIVEMGAYNKGGIKLLCDIAQPKIGIVTGFNEQHLSTFGSMENLISAEGGLELLEFLPEQGSIALNWDNQLISQNPNFEKKKIKKIKYSLFKKEDFWPENIKISRNEISFRAISKDKDSADFKVAVPGAYNILNILGASAIAKELAMSLEEISRACRKIQPEQIKTKIKKGTNNLNIIDSTYSANPDSVMAHLEDLKNWPGRKIIIMPCLIELGTASKKIHREIGRKIDQTCHLAIITTKDRFEEIQKETGEKAVLIEKPEEVLEKIKKFCQPNDVILLEGRLPKKLTGKLFK